MEQQKKEFTREYLIPILLQLVALFLCMRLFGFAINQGPFVQAQEIIGDELTSPTLGRLVFVVVGFVVSIIMSNISSVLTKKDKIDAAFWVSVVAGTFLWQSLGEGVWHFSMMEIHMVQLESISVFPFSIIFLLLLIANFKCHYFDFGLTTYLYSFACNWYGHYVMLATYPFAQNHFDENTWFIISGCGSGVILLFLSFYLAKKKVKTKQERLHCSMLTYIALGLIAFSFIG